MDNPTELVDRLERAAMAYERLGKISRDDEKTRQMRKDTIAALAETRTAVLGRVAPLTAERDEARTEAAILAERESCAKVADKMQADYLKRSLTREGPSEVFELSRGNAAQAIAAAIRARGEGEQT